MFAPAAARAVIFVSTGDPSYNTTAPTGALANSGWQYEFNWSSFLGTPVDAHHFLSAAHIGGGAGSQFSLNGTTYTTVPFADNSPYQDFGDLRLFQVDKPFYSYAPLYDTTTDGAESGKTVVVTGRGRQRGSAVVVGGVTKGWTWGTFDDAQRWGQNKVTGVADYKVQGDGKLIQLNFDASGTGYTGANEATLAEGDSGGGTFINVNGQWKLAGINYAVTGPYAYTSDPNETPFMAALTDQGGLYDRSGDSQGLPPSYISDAPTDKPSSWFASRVSVSLSGIKGYLSLPPTWNIDAAGNWGAASNWVNGPVPNGVGATADFRYAITAPRTITVDAARTVGTIDFDSPNAYTIAGTSTLTLDVPSGSAAVNVASGAHVISAPLTLNDATTFNVIPSSAKLTISGTFTAAGRAVTKVGQGTLEVPNVRAASLAVNEGTVKVLSNGGAGGTSKVATLSVASAARLDLTNNAAVVTTKDTGSWNGSAYTGLTGQIARGYNGGTWTGPGIVSSTAAGQGKLYSIGIADSSQALGISGTTTKTWAGQTVDANSTLIRYTYGGDANLDGQINIDDYGRIDANAGAAGASGWYNGDFNYDGKINIDDYGIIDANMGTQGAPLGAAFALAAPAGAGVTAVPEPAALAAVGLAATSLFSRRRRRRG